MSNHIGTTKIRTASGTQEVPVFDPADLEEPGWFRVETPAGTGAVRLVDVPDATLEEYRAQTPGGLKGVATSLGEIPDSEGYEHNDLTGNYGGDTGQFSIQTGTVDEGTYALSGSGGGTLYGITRSTESAWDRNGIRVRWRQYTPSSGGAGGLMFNTSVTGLSSADGYMTYFNGGTGDFDVRRLDDGSRTVLDSTSPSAATDSWVDAQIEFAENGSITYSMDGNTSVSATDTNYTQLLLGFLTYRDVYVDDVRFEVI